MYSDLYDSHSIELNVPGNDIESTHSTSKRDHYWPRGSGHVGLRANTFSTYH